MSTARANAARIQAAMPALRQVAPEVGSYVSECGFALADLQQACWGANWARLDQIKRNYDPNSLFIVHHSIGSEKWPSDRFDHAESETLPTTVGDYVLAKNSRL